MPWDNVRVELVVEYAAAKEGGYRLLQCVELVQEALVRYEGTLSDKCRAIDEVRALLKDTVPMLRREITSESLSVHTLLW